MAKTDEGARWAQEVVRRVGAAIKAARGDKSAKWLSDRTAELGYRISPTVIAKLDSGHRGSVLSVPELLVLAAALDIAPVALLYPAPYSEDVEFLPGVKRRKIDAVQEFSGFIEEGVNPDYARNVFELNRARQIAEALRSLDRLAAGVDILGGTEYGEGLQERSDRVKARLERLRIADGW